MNKQLWQALEGGSSDGYVKPDLCSFTLSWKKFIKSVFVPEKLEWSILFCLQNFESGFSQNTALMKLKHDSSKSDSSFSKKVCTTLLYKST